MPELPEVETTRRGIAQTVIGRQIAAAIVREPRLRWRLPADFADQRTPYYQALNKPLDPDTFLTGLQRQMQQALQRLDTGMPHNPGVKILQRPQGWIRVAKMARQPDPPN